jgi:hypothetical protein
MKKNKMSKLSLNRETLRSLEENQMLRVNGGGQETKKDCNTQYTYCGSCGIACTAIDCTP